MSGQGAPHRTGTRSVFGMPGSGNLTATEQPFSLAKGRRTIDIHCYAAPNGGEKKPTRKGLQVDVKQLPALLEALQGARQHL